MRLPFVRMLVAPMLLSASACGRTHTADGLTAAPYSAVVTATTARFVFPLVQRKEWQWYRAKTPAGNLEYGWTVDVPNSGRIYQIGFLIFKYPDAQPARGDLAALLRAGQKTIWVGDERTRSVLKGWPVRVIPEGNRIVVVIDDAQTLERIFSGRPSRVTFRVQLPARAEVIREVSLRYAP